jgi:MinD-like ATPase involved in chromosome partitioning or flagellar assembly
MSIYSLYTWRDVASLLAAVPSPPWRSADADAGGVHISCAAEREGQARRVLEETFGQRFRDQRIRLESLPANPRHLDVYWDLSETEPSRSRRVVRPLWLDSHLSDPLPKDQQPTVRIAAFFSYKGGVGRTTCLLATAGALLQQIRPAKVLIVDADLEAPGITWNIPGPPDRLSLLDALGLIHDEDDWKAQAIPLIADWLMRNQEIRELQSGRVSFFFLPAFRSFDQIFSLPVTFEQLVRARGRSHIIADALVAIGEALGVDVVLVDLRAGITDFSSPLLLDGRVQSILVTSCNEQSIEGTVRTLERMRRRAQAPTSPEVVISLIPPGEESLATDISERIFAALPDLEDEEEIDLNRTVHRVAFAQELLHFSSLEDLLAKRIPGTDLGKRVAPQIAQLLWPEPAKPPLPAGDARQAEAPRDMERLIEVCKRLEHAESSVVKGLLPTTSLTALVESYTTVLPAAVVLGSKGAGKTFAWSQMIAAGTWSGFSSLITQEPERGNGEIFPLLGPLNVSGELAKVVADAEARTWKALGVSRGLPMEKLRDTLEDMGDEPRDDLAFWLGMVARRLGLSEEAGRSLESLAAALHVPLVLVADGFEDAFQLSAEKPLSEGRRKALRGLLQKLVPQIRDLAASSLGAVIFLRRDLAEESIPQNFGQFEALYSRFSLVWSPTEALRLAAWLLKQADRSVLDPEKIPNASYEELRQALQELWGNRMGSEKSKETYTDRWVIAALSDLQGRLQPRDIVRLIRYAAEKDRRTNRLSPQSLRAALAECSAAKIDELQEEVRALKPIFSKLSKADADKRTIPFNPQEIGLSDEEVAFLKRQGIATTLGEDPELYMPEIVRQGLKFKLKQGRRAKVLALYRAAQLKNP